MAYKLSGYLAIWKPPRRPIWAYLGRFWLICFYLGISAAIWAYLGLFNSIWGKNMINISKSTMAFAVVALLSFGSNPAFSADDDEESAEVEEVVVTGSRIK